MFRHYDRIFKAILNLLIGFALFAGIIAPPRLLAAPINAIQAKAAVETFLTARFPTIDPSSALTLTATGASWLAVTEVTPLLDNDIIVGYITTLEPSGYVLVRADDEVPPVKIYTENGTFDRLPPGFLKVIKLELAEELQNLAALKQSNAPIDPEFQEEWSSLLNPGGPQTPSYLPTSAPGVVLLTTTWNQDDPYNYYCPTATGGPGGRAYAGCTACALSQILRYHSAPTQVSEDHTYTDSSGSCTGSHSISDAGMGAYDWGNMPTSITTSSPLSERQAIGQLMYHAGVALESNYEGDGTGAFPSDIPGVLSTYFSYTSGSYESKSSFTSSQWYSKISTDIDISEPVFYAMWESDGQHGHAVVCDGYRNGDEIHLNLGWSGSGNLWYDIDTVSYSSYTWTVHRAVFEITPLGGILSAPVLTGEPAVTPGTENTIYWSAVSSMQQTLVVGEASNNPTKVNAGGVFSGVSSGAMCEELNVPQPPSQSMYGISTNDNNLRVDDGFEPAQATLSLESVFVPEVEGEKVISESEPLAATTIFNETFEGSFPGTSWILYGDPTWDDTSYDKHGGSWSGWCGDSTLNPADGYTDNMAAWMVYGPFSLADATSASMSFWYKNLSESGFDYFGWYASVDGVNFYGYKVSGDQNSWRSQVFDLTNVYTLGDLSGQPQVWIAFVFTSDGLYSGPMYTGAFVDDVIITKDSALSQPNLIPYKPSGWSDKIVVSKVTGTNTDSSPLYTTDTLYVDWAAINNGTAATAVRFYSELYVDGVLKTSWYTDPPLNVGNYAYVQDYSIGTLAAGTHTIRIKTDSTEVIAENNESDNEYTKTVTVAEPVLTEYYAECADNNFFISARNSGWTTQRQWTFINLTPSQTYWYRVKAKSGTTESDWSNVEYSQQESSNPCTLDIDGNGQYDALTDGILILRYLFGFRGATLIDGAVAPDCTRCTAPEIEAWLADCESCCLDIDGNGAADALTDGILILRYLFGFRGITLIDGAVAPDCTRCTAPEIEAYIQDLMP